MPGGFKTRGLRVKGDDTPIAPGEFRDVDVPSGAMKDNIMPLPYKEPSQTLMALLNQIVEEGRRFASSGDLKASDMSSQSPVGTTLAILERTLKVMSAIQARIHFSMKQEFKLLKKIIADYAPEDYSYEPTVGSAKARRSDYEMVNIVPVSDPNAATMSQKVVQYQAALQLSQTAPQLYNLPYLHRQMLEVIGIKNVEKMLPMPDEQNPVDPVTENMNALKIKPLKAFIGQDHKGHIAIHTAALNDPSIKKTIGQNPQAPQIMQALQAHIAEHVGMEYLVQMQQQMGIQIPYNGDEDPDFKITPEQEMQITRLAVPAAQNLLNQNKTAMAAQQAQQAAQDPVIQMQMKELQLKAQEIEIKQKKMQIDAAKGADQIEIEKMRIAAQKEIAGMQIGAKTAADKANLSAKQELEGMRLGHQIGSAKAQLNQQKQAQKLQVTADLYKAEQQSKSKKETK